jgi:hypothetical protein
VLHRPDRCEATKWKLPTLTSRDRSDRWCSPACRCWSVDSRFGVPLCSRVGRLCVGSYVQWHSSGYVVLANLGSESETCVGSRVHRVGVSISFEKNFYRLPFTPPLWFAVSVLQEFRGKCICPDRACIHEFGSSFPLEF